MTEDLKELKDKIIDKAEQKAQRVVERASKTQQRNIKRGKRKAKKIKRKAEKQAESEFETEQQKIIHETKVKKRRIQLRARQKVLEKLRQDLKQRITSLFEKGELDDWMKELVEEEVLVDKVEYELFCRENMTEKYRQLFSEHDNITITGESEEPGFMLVSQEEEYDFRFGTIADRLVEAEKETVLSVLNIGEENNG